MALGAALTVIFLPIHAPMAVLAKLAKSQRLFEIKSPFVLHSRTDGLVSNCMGCVWCFDEVVRFVNKNALISMVWSHFLNIEMRWSFARGLQLERLFRSRGRRGEEPC